ncbi:hypothetical protein Leryth_012744 [Lithospermum erythrorhizon]|nr:hypothetical protein Leryth_012744 [Lithospermum erythrorhizon]
MPCTSVPPWHTCYYPIPKHLFNQQNLRLQLNRSIRSSIKSTEITRFTNQHNSLATHHATTNSCNKDQGTQNNRQVNNPEDPVGSSRKNTENLRDLYPSSETQKPNFEEFQEDINIRRLSSLGILSGSWIEFKAALGQRINIEGLACSVGILARNKNLAIPNLSVPDIRFIDWAELKRRGFQGVVFDKDNTLTIPYNLRLWAPLGESLEQCRSLFGNNVAVFSNSAGLHEYDPDGRKAKALERSIGIRVIRHMVKKPAGTAEEIERHFGCESSRLIMIGDRPFTDIVYGNKNGFLTILTNPLSVDEEPFIVKQF